MLNRLLLVLMIAIACTTVSLPVFADTNDTIYSVATQSTSQFLVTITRPDGDESTFKTSYVICGNTVYEDMRIELLILDKYGKFVPFTTASGENSWDIGSSGIFVKEVKLPKEGANRIRIAAYKKSEYTNLVLGTNLQINDFTITVLNEGIKNIIKNGLLRVSDLLKGFLNK